MHKPKRTADRQAKQKFAREHPGMEENKTLLRNQFLAIYGNDPLKANLHPNEFNIDFKNEVHFNDLVGSIINDNKKKVENQVKTWDHYNDIQTKKIPNIKRGYEAEV